MATYAELLGLYENPELFNKVRVAVWVAADSIRTESTPTAARTAWAKQAFGSPDSVARMMMPAVLAQNKASSVATILGASDAQVQTAVDNAVNVTA